MDFRRISERYFQLFEMILSGVVFDQCRNAAGWWTINHFHLVPPKMDVYANISDRNKGDFH